MKRKSSPTTSAFDTHLNKRETKNISIHNLQHEYTRFIKSKESYKYKESNQRFGATPIHKRSKLQKNRKKHHGYEKNPRGLETSRRVSWGEYLSMYEKNPRGLETR